MKIKLNLLLAEARGKMSKRKDSPILAYNSKLDVAYAYFLLKKNPRVEEPTEQQIACKNKFAATIAAIKTKKANPTEWEAIKEGFRNQTRYKTLWNYAFAVIYPTIS